MSHDWKNILVSSEFTLKQVLKVIDNESLKLALVVDSKNMLLGTITDGDIRRALIKNISLDTCVIEVMNRKPTVVEYGTPKNELLGLMEKKELHALPVLNNGEVVGLETLYQVIQPAKYDNPVFIMAGGFGTRLRPLTDSCPKPMLSVGEKPILEIVLTQFIKAGFRNFFFSTHYLPEVIRDYFGNGDKWGVSINYVYEEAPLGTGGALGLLPANLPKLPVIVMNGDVLTKVDFEGLLSFHLENKSSATMCVREYEYQVPFGVIESNDNEIVSMTEKPTYRYHVNAGIYVIDPDIIDSVKENERIDMPTLLERFLSDKIMIFPFYEYWLDIGRMDDYQRAQEDVKNLGVL
mgnify:CR=1 FL=1